jgi:DNA-binding NarL/FixJ family response regulator
MAQIVVAMPIGLLRQGIEAWFLANSKHKIGAVGDSAEALAQRGFSARVLILDGDQRDRAGLLKDLTTCTELRWGSLVLGESDHPARTRRALALGASGYVCLSSSMEDLERAVDTVAAGGLHIATRSARKPTDGIHLSGQERRAVELYVAGLTLDAVARRMNVTPGTAKEYLDRVRAKYAKNGRWVRTRTDLYAAAMEEGLLA